MKVVQLLPELNEGGVERGVVELNREFVDGGLQSVVISNGGRLAEQITAHGGQHITFDVCSKNPFTVPRRVIELRRLLRSLQPDIVHARSRVPAWLAYFARKKCPFNFVTTVHGMNSVNRYSRIMTAGDKVICVSEVIREHLLKNYPVDPHKLVVIQRGVDLRSFDPMVANTALIDAFKDEFALHGRYVVTSVGRITHLKDYETFIRAVAACRTQIPHIKGLIIGGVHPDRASYFAELQQLVESLGAADLVSFADNQRHMPEIYLLSDLVVNASLKMSNVGRTVTEALAMNTPVLATTLEGLNNLVKDGINGYIIRTQDPTDLRDKILLAQASPMRNIRATVDPEFTLTKMAEKTLGVYRSFGHQ